MAATKKSPTKRTKSASRSSTTARKRAYTKSSLAKQSRPNTARKASPKRAPSKSRSTTNVRRSTTPSMRSFRRHKTERPFVSYDITVQTVYWVIIGVTVVGLAAWMLVMHNRIQDIYDDIDRSQPVQRQVDSSNSAREQ